MPEDPLLFPPHRILAAVDFSPPSRVALTMAARLAAQCGAELHVVHAEDPLLCAEASGDGHDFCREVREELDHFLHTAALPPHIVPCSHVVAGSAANVICDVAAREVAGLIVIAARGISGAERFLGSTAEGVLRHAQVPVLMVPHGWAPPDATAADLSGAGPIIAGIDFTEPSLHAAVIAARLAAMLPTSLELVHIVPVRPVIPRWESYSAQSAQRRLAAARRQLSRMARSLTASVPIETRLTSGLVPEGLAGAARAHAGDHALLVLGRRSATERGDAPGATAYRVVTLAHVPTLVVVEPPD